MNKTILLPLATTLLFVFMNAFAEQPVDPGSQAKKPSAPVIQWIQQFGTIGAAVDTGQAVASDSSGNIYIVGRVPGALPSQVNAGSGDVFLRKYDANGQLVWTQQFGSAGDDTAFSVAVKGNGVYVGGRVGGALPGKTFLGISDAFLSKFDTNGNLLWTDQFGTNNVDEIRMVAVDDTVSPVAVYVTGQTLGTLPGQTSAGLADVFIRKYEDNGGSFAVVNTVQFGSKTPTGGSANATDTGTVISIDTSLSPTAIYVGGIVNADIDGAGPEIFKGATDGFVQRRDPNLNIIWTRQFGDTGGDFVDAGAASVGNGVYVAGRTNSGLNGPVIGSFDAYTTKYDPNGNQIWLQQFGTTTFDQALSVAVDATKVYVVGFTGGSLYGTSAGSNDGFLNIFDAAGNVISNTQAGSPGSDQFTGVTVNGVTIYVSGSSEGALTGNGIENTENAGNGDAILRKYDMSLNDIWTNRFGTSGPINDVANALVRTATGDVYIAGSTRGPLPSMTHSGLNDAYIRKYDSAGNTIWTRQFGTVVNDTGVAIAASENGRVCVVGATEGSLGAAFAGGPTDGYVRCYDKLGNVLWTRQIGTSLQDDASGVAIDQDGAVIVGGRADGALPNQSGPLGAINAFIRKFDAAGNEIWTRQYVAGGADGVSQVFALTADVYNNIFVGGRTFRSFTGEPILGTFDAYLRKFDAAGNVIWTRQIGSTLAANDQVSALSTDPNGNVYAAGFAGGPLPGQCIPLPSPCSYVNGNDAYIRKYDANGNILWTDAFGTSGNDAASAVYANASEVYIGGSVAGALPGQTSAGGVDAYARKYSANGNVIWTMQLGLGIGSSLNDAITGISASQSGDLYLSGITAGALSGQTSAGDNDAFVVKIRQK